jgi:ribosomal protein S18 acetylase RimI-like enzyme
MATWRLADPADDDAIVAMSMALYEGNPPEPSMSPAQVRATLVMFRAEPTRGRAIVLDADGQPGGYAFLVSFWSNELGGEICTIDELYVMPRFRSQGFSTHLVESLVNGGILWPRRPVALELEVHPRNTRARALYERLGFRLKNNDTLRRITTCD